MNPVTGYGTVGGRVLGTQAHRTAWELAHGAIPKKMCVCHRCDVPLCVNLDHLFLGTHRDNTRDSVAKGRFRLWRVTGRRLNGEPVVREQAV